jgi:GH25 family lysozyme M1 (1,4-beta-N-acetylmuramidase)
MLVLDFIDVSMWQGPIDWYSVPVPAVIKISEGYFDDPRGVENVAGARAVRKCMGVYHFLSSNMPGDLQAERMFDTYTHQGEELIVLDWETDSIGVLPDPSIAEAFVQKIRDLGFGQFLRMYGNAHRAPYAHGWEIPFWCAWYPMGNPDQVEQAVLATGAVAWQWASTEFVDGIPGRIDANKILVPDQWQEHTMTAEEFAAFLGPRAKASGGVVYVQLADDNWYPLGDAVRWTHEHAKNADLATRGDDGGATADEIVEAIGKALLT